MQRLTLAGLPLAALLALASAAPVIGAQPGPATDAPGRLSDTNDGPVLVTSTGMTLYTSNGDDVAGGKSSCNSTVNREMTDVTGGLGKVPLPGYTFIKSCLDMWKPYQAPANAKSGGDWSVFARPDGVSQWVYKGKPVYLSVRDTAPGDRNGVMGDASGFGGFGGGGPAFAFAGQDRPVFPVGMKIIRLGNAMVIAGADGKPVYTPRAGARVQQASFGGTTLQPVEAASVVKLDGDWSTVDAGAGRAQYAWKGKPLFTAPSGLSASDAARAGFDPVVYRRMAAPPAEIGTRFTLVGEVYTDRAGKTLYMYSCTQTGCDLPGGGAASMAGVCGSGQECMRRWHPYIAAANARPSGEWSIVDLPQPMFTDGAGQIYPAGVPRVKTWAYRGRPVFTYYQDQQPGDIMGNMTRWFGMASFSAMRVPGRGTTG